MNLESSDNYNSITSLFKIIRLSNRLRTINIFMIYFLIHINGNI